MSPEMFEFARPRSGRKATRSRTRPRTPGGEHRERERDEDVEAEVGDERERRRTHASMKTAAWARFRMSRTPKTSV